ncbi:hypothetical protein C8F04DRAFT_1394417 [Mycena alexandri]|uniref:Protein kinase domain-containing protein n=1 Tax=Mycena alexandri TaxID=1745969 RepID=A0AAD6X8M9_9AGAR|nr:hypothetical protein C8F04DRAFT_1394417 [Mycena alexandri]
MHWQKKNTQLASSPTTVIDRRPQPGPQLHGRSIPPSQVGDNNESPFLSGETATIASDRATLGHAVASETMIVRPRVTSQMTQASPAIDKGKLVVAVDFGTNFSSVAYGSSRLNSSKIQQILNWPGSSETFRKIPTCLLYDELGHIVAWGLEAKYALQIPGTAHYKRFKLFLEPGALRDERLPSLPPGKKPTDLITDFLHCLWEYVREQITRDNVAIADLNSADVWVTVPAAWDTQGCSLMHDASIAAGLVQSAYPGDVHWPDRLKIITEPEAVAVHCAHLTDFCKLRPSQNFIVCDVGGETVDLTVHKIMGDPAHLEITAIAARSDATCGSSFLDLRFRILVETLLSEHPGHLDSDSLAHFGLSSLPLANFPDPGTVLGYSFGQAEKLNYAGRGDDETTFYFNCFNVVDLDDPSVGLLNGQLAIPGRLLREAVFDPVVNEVVGLILQQLDNTPDIDALLLVGGFSRSAYLQARVEEEFKHRIHTLVRPPDSDTATVRGAAWYGLLRHSLGSRFAPVAPPLVLKTYPHINDAEIEITEYRPHYHPANGTTMPTNIVIYEALLLFLMQACSSNAVGGGTNEGVILQRKLEGYQVSMAFNDVVSAIVESLECRKVLLELSSKIGLDNNEEFRLALRRDEGRIATYLESIFECKSAQDAVLGLEGDSAQYFLDVVQNTLDRGFIMAPEHTRMAHRIVRKLSEACDGLPSSLFISGVSGCDDHPTFGGGYGDIFHASHGGKPVALKRMRYFLRGTDLRRLRLKFYRETLVWRDLRHPHILPFLGIDRDSFPSSLCMVSPWMEHGTILNYLKNHGHGNVDQLASFVLLGHVHVVLNVNFSFMRSLKASSIFILKISCTETCEG